MGRRGRGTRRSGAEEAGEVSEALPQRRAQDKLTKERFFLILSAETKGVTVAQILFTAVGEDRIFQEYDIS